MKMKHKGIFRRPKYYVPGLKYYIFLAPLMINHNCLDFSNTMRSIQLVDFHYFTHKHKMIKPKCNVAWKYFINTVEHPKIS